MSSHTLVESIFSKYAKGGGESAFEVCALLVRIIELWWLRETQCFHFASLFVKTWFERGGGVWSLVIAVLGLNC
jgi:hypothetical protein